LSSVFYADAGVRGVAGASRESDAVKPPRRYTASVPRDDVAFYLASGWELDGDATPSRDYVPICWRRATRPTALPLGWRVVRAGRVWQ
jgi:hypothetical protein